MQLVSSHMLLQIPHLDRHEVKAFLKSSISEIPDSLQLACCSRLHLQSAMQSEVRGPMSRETLKNVVNTTVISKTYVDIVYARTTSTNLQKVQQI